MQRYRSELMQSVNKATGKSTYYVLKCNAMSRISKAEYNKRYDESDGIECLYTKSTKTHIRHYLTCIYYH